MNNGASTDGAPHRNQSTVDNFWNFLLKHKDCFYPRFFVVPMSVFNLLPFDEKSWLTNQYRNRTSWYLAAQTVVTIIGRQTTITAGTTQAFQTVTMVPTNKQSGQTNIEVVQQDSIVVNHSPTLRHKDKSVEDFKGPKNPGFSYLF
eukprot:sb/3473844/